jgi:hypothetical protein
LAHKKVFPLKSFGKLEFEMWGDENVEEFDDDVRMRIFKFFFIFFENFLPLFTPNHPVLSSSSLSRQNCPNKHFLRVPYFPREIFCIRHSN